MITVTGAGGSAKARSEAWSAVAGARAQSAMAGETAHAATASGRSWSTVVECAVRIGDEPYTGEYHADALFEQQVFATRGKTLADDFTVHAINYTEAPNDSGVTVTIGG